MQTPKGAVRCWCFGIRSIMVTMTKIDEARKRWRADMRRDVVMTPQWRMTSPGCVKYRVWPGFGTMYRSRSHTQAHTRHSTFFLNKGHKYENASYGGWHLNSTKIYVHNSCHLFVNIMYQIFYVSPCGKDIVAMIDVYFRHQEINLLSY